MKVADHSRLPFPPDIRFRDDNLYLWYGCGGAVIAGWPRMLAWKKFARSKAWSFFPPDVQVERRIFVLRTNKNDPLYIKSPELKYYVGVHRGLLMGKFLHFESQFPELEIESETKWRKALDEWCDTIPEQVRKAVSPFNYRQWHLLSMIARCGSPSLDLIHSNPALAWLLVSGSTYFNPRVRSSMRTIRNCLPKKQHVICGRLGFPARKATMKILKKIPPGRDRAAALLLPPGRHEGSERYEDTLQHEHDKWFFRLKSRWINP